LAFHAETIDAETQLARAGQSQSNPHGAGFYVGLRGLAEGKRAEAKEWFTRCIDAGVFIYWEYMWSRRCST
jgi:hypothetical protein